MYKRIFNLKRRNKLRWVHGVNGHGMLYLDDSHGAHSIKLGNKNKQFIISYKIY